MIYRHVLDEKKKQRSIPAEHKEWIKEIQRYYEKNKNKIHYTPKIQYNATTGDVYQIIDQSIGEHLGKLAYKDIPYKNKHQ